MKLRQGDPWMSGREYGMTLSGLTVNLLVREIEAACAFQRKVLRAEIVYSDPDFAAIEGFGASWMLHADHTYESHPMGATLDGLGRRGEGVELRLHGCDPDHAVAAARAMGMEILSPATDEGEGLRDAHIRDSDGYTWVPTVWREYAPIS